jgi:8-oxo-dGTP diphosphatase
MRPGVGVAVVVKKDGKILIGRRSSELGYGTWQTPGGHLEFGESFEECAKRETKEETGIEIDNLRFLAVTNDIFEKEGSHYVTIWMSAEYRGGEPKRGWYWEDIEDIRRKNLFLPVKNLFKLVHDF